MNKNYVGNTFTDRNLAEYTDTVHTCTHTHTHTPSEYLEALHQGALHQILTEPTPVVLRDKNWHNFKT